MDLPREVDGYPAELKWDNPAGTAEDRPEGLANTDRALEPFLRGDAGAGGPQTGLGLTVWEADLPTVVDSINGHWKEEAGSQKIFSASQTPTHDIIF